ncbi:MAG TPA: CPBP family intramembrane glutamic endopeptidase [Candidatus Sulfotelmatobacter sp.]
MNRLDNTEADHSPVNPLDPVAPTFAAIRQPSYARTLFLGAEGLRPGWGILFYFLMFYALERLAGVITTSWKLGALRVMMLDEVVNVLCALIPSVVLARIEHRHWSNFGLSLGQTFGKLFWVGAGWGFAGITILIGSQYEMKAFDFGHIALHGAGIARYAAFWIAMFLLVALFEEFLLRGYVQYTLARGLGFWPAAVVLSCAFGLIHIWNGGEEWPGLLAAATIGFFFCLTLRRTGSLWFAVGFHAAWDWGETFFYSVPDSGTLFPGHLLSSSFHGPRWLTGGSVGPEGSAFCFIVIGVLWLAFNRIYPASGVITNEAVPQAY